MRATLSAPARIVIPFVVALSLTAVLTEARAQVGVQVPAPKAAQTPAPPSAIERVLGELTPAIMAALLVLATIGFSIALFAEISRGGSVAIESSWGGFGGSLGGWRLSPGLVYLLVVLFFGAMSMGVLQRVRPAESSVTQGAPATAPSPAPASQSQTTPAANTTVSAK